HLIDVSNMALNRIRCDEIFFDPDGNFDLVAIDLVYSAVFLNSADRPRVPSFGVEIGSLLYGEGILVIRRTFAAVRVRSQLFVAHELMITGSSPPLAGYPQGDRVTSARISQMRVENRISTGPVLILAKIE